MRRSFSCMLAGAMIVTPLIIFTAPGIEDWHPHRGVAVAAVVSIGIIGIMILYDELSELLRR
jgi:hypothetical protein